MNIDKSNFIIDKNILQLLYMMQSIKLKEEITEIRSKMEEIKSQVIEQKRALTDEEEEQLKTLRQEIEDKQKEIEELEKKAEDETPDEVKEEVQKKLDEADEKKCNKTDEQKNIIRSTMELNSLQKRFMDVVNNREYNREINLNKRTIQVTGQNGTHDAVIKEDFTDILEPLYANSIISKLGIQTRTGLVNDLHVPKMEKGTVGFLGEIEAANATGNAFNYITLTPKRIGAYVDVSEQQLIQDSIGVFAAVQRNLIKKLNEYIEVELFSNHAGSALRPAGMLYNVTPTVVTNYAGVCDLEAGVEEDNVYGAMKYAMNPKAKALFRSTIKGTNATGMIYEYGEMDGTPTEVTSAVPENNFIYGNWDNLLFASWADTILKVSDSATGLITGEVRVYLGAYIDWAVLRPEAFAYGTVSE